MQRDCPVAERAGPVALLSLAACSLLDKAGEPQKDRRYISDGTYIHHAEWCVCEVAVSAALVSHGHEGEDARMPRRVPISQYLVGLR